MKLSEFFQSSPEILCDGCPIDASRIEIRIPDETALITAIRRLVRLAFADREAALNFLLDVRSKLPIKEPQQNGKSQKI